MNIDTIFFIGPQGSGKGTQAKILSQKLGFFSWDMGAILRKVAASETELGKKVKSLIDAGILLSDEDLYEVLKFQLGEIPSSQGVVFDGVPRRIGQAEFLINYLKQTGRTNILTLFINVPHEESVKRLLKRGEIEKRADDTLEKVEFRLKQYEEDTVPVLDYLKQHTNFFEINGHQGIEDVTKEIDSKLEIKASNLAEA